MNVHLKVAEAFTYLMESRFHIGNFRFGIEPLLGLIPGIGDVISFILSYYLVWIGHQMNIPAVALSKMYRNVIFDFVLGLIPIVGDSLDFFNKANVKNLEILKQYATSQIEGEIVE